MAHSAQDTIISEDQFKQTFAEGAKDFLEFTNLLLEKAPTAWFKRHYSELAARAHETETFLDDFGARHNRQYAQLAELVACLRGFGRVAVAHKHLISRYPRYDHGLSPEFTSDFFAEIGRTTEFLDDSILSLTKAIHTELVALQVTVPTTVRADETVSEEGAQLALPNDIDSEDVVEEDARIAEVASMYMSVADEFGWAAEVKADGADELRAMVLQHLDEERTRHYEAMVHSLQSKYDTYVGGTALERTNPFLRGLRGHASIALHLLEMGTELIHFYVRHENDVRAEHVKARVAGLVDKGVVLDRAILFSVRFSARILLEGKRFAQEALAAFVKADVLELELPESEVLHARPISLIVKIVQYHGTRVEMRIDEESCSAGSIMEMIMTAGNHPDARRLTFEGGSRTLEDLRILFDHRLGEAGIEKLPDALAYLR